MTFVITDEHKRVFEATGHVLITGGPGSGKTATALQKAKRYIDDGKLGYGQKVLFLSFSRAAVARICEKADLDLRDRRYQRLLAIQTFHSFFWEIVKSHGYLLGAPRRLRVLAPHDEDSLREGRGGDETTWLEEREKMFHEGGRVCFDLFAPLAMDIIKQSSSIKELLIQKYPLVIIDEAQDTNTLQWQCIGSLAHRCQMIALADLDQQIYDYRKDVSAERIAEIVKELKPLQVPFGRLNHRSASNEIVDFAHDLLNNTPRPGSYNAVSIMPYPPRADQRDLHIRQSIGRINKKLTDILGRPPESLAVLATWGKGVKIISNALRGSDPSKTINHRVQFDETATYLSSRLIAFFLEPKRVITQYHLASAIDIMAELSRAKGERSDWKKLDAWSAELKQGRIPKRSKVIPEIDRVLQTISGQSFSGIPERDWTRVKKMLLSSNSGALVAIGKNAEYLMAFNRGRRISAGLTRKWQEQGGYYDARNVLEAAIVETQIVSESRSDRGINVMTIHKAKGKEFDGVIMFHDLHSSPFVLRGDAGALKRSRKLLFVGITRARYHTMILQDVTIKCPIIEKFNL